MPVYVEIWCEKDALAGVLMTETEIYDVPLMVAKGYASLSFLHSAAMTIRAKKKPTYIYHFGDLDPSGVDAARDIEAKLRRYAPDAEIHFERPAVTREQVEQWNLPTRPTKMTDTRAKNFVGTSVELDAIPAAKLRELVRGCIERHIDPHKLALTRVAEESERELFTSGRQPTRGGHDPRRTGAARGAAHHRQRGRLHSVGWRKPSLRRWADLSVHHPALPPAMERTLPHHDALTSPAQAARAQQGQIVLGGESWKKAARYHVAGNKTRPP